jgi:hypothetical protein
MWSIHQRDTCHNVFVFKMTKILVFAKKMKKNRGLGPTKALIRSCMGTICCTLQLSIDTKEPLITHTKLNEGYVIF